VENKNFSNHPYKPFLKKPFEEVINEKHKENEN